MGSHVNASIGGADYDSQLGGEVGRRGRKRARTPPYSDGRSRKRTRRQHGPTNTHQTTAQRTPSDAWEDQRSKYGIG